MEKGLLHKIGVVNRKRIVISKRETVYLNV